MPKTKFELTPSEWNIMKAVWKGEPCTAPDIQQKLSRSTGWTYSTVRTLMDRMVIKGTLTASKSGKLTLFRAAISRAQAQRSELLYALKQAFNGALTPMVQCLLETEELSPEQLAELESLLRAKRKGTKLRESPD